MFEKSCKGPVLVVSLPQLIKKQIYWLNIITVLTHKLKYALNPPKSKTVCQETHELIQ